jgi:hypothetical protein
MNGNGERKKEWDATPRVTELTANQPLAGWASGFGFFKGSNHGHMII